ncbi:sorting nexin lst-4-like isoform X3 [Mizuhopecten yessoensis]|uniref:Sorting nexin n=1 Tax=Mizuhopecten yessoensis TaxID=6573 RepID=A0A210QP59_MIZYE|nr:sorting nexin lst-4-like isoform X3 [Mizuhopecten yessoensis]OWF50530.1 Sorting nexin-33 [Mizuhopecten yessoensis]
MAETTARALYDFDGDPDNGELSFRGGDVLAIIALDIGDGWWEARNDLGHQGLVPEAYLQISEEPPEPSFPPPPPPMSTPPVGGDYPDDPRASQYSTGTTSTTNGYNSQYQNTPADIGGGDYPVGGGFTTQQSTDEWDEDEWEEDDDHSSTSTDRGTSQELHLQGQGNFGLSTAKREPKQISPSGDMSKYGTVKKSFNRFSHFAKAGGEAFMMSQVQNENVSENDVITITETADGPVWPLPTDTFTCEVASPKKESKLKGLKSYIAYQITPSFSNIQVSRRYKHFDWLHERLEEKFACVPIPPLPDKALSGRYEDDFITERMHLLQLWINRIVRHPLISRSDVFHHFLTCTNEKKWKEGKRKAEKDEYTGGKFFLLLRTPVAQLEERDVDKTMETFCKFVKGMDDNVKGLITVMNENRKKHLGPYKREYQKIGQSFKNLATTFNLDNSSFSGRLTAAIDYTGDTYNQIGDMFEKQPRADLDPVLDVLYEYKGILSTFPDVLKIHEGAVGRAKECKKEQDEGKMSESDVQKVVNKADIITYGTMAQMSHFQAERVQDYKAMMQKYLKEQIQFYRNITQQLEETLVKFEDA